jgi:hypothetical protein
VEVPPDCRRRAFVRHPETGALSGCVVVATNATPEELEKGENLEVIQACQKALDRRVPLKQWYIVRTP